MPLIKDCMLEAHDGLKGLADKLRAALPNENLADIVNGAANRCKQASEHADAEYSAEDVHAAAAEERKLERPGVAEASGKPPPVPPSTFNPVGGDPLSGIAPQGRSASEAGSG